METTGKTYTKRSDARRGAVRALGEEAKEGPDFSLEQNAEGKWFWEAIDAFAPVGNDSEVSTDSDSEVFVHQRKEGIDRREEDRRGGDGLPTMGEQAEQEVADAGAGEAPAPSAGAFAAFAATQLKSNDDTPAPAPVIKAPRARGPAVYQNGQRQPTVGTIAAKLWELFDLVGARLLSKDVKGICEANGINNTQGTITLYEWRKFHGYGNNPQAKAAAAKIDVMVNHNSAPDAGTAKEGE